MAEQDHTSDVDIRKIHSQVLQAVKYGRSFALDLDISAFDQSDEGQTTSLANAIDSMVKKIMRRDEGEPQGDKAKKQLPNAIVFPYARHSPYEELCLLLKAFRPRDVWPCTVETHDWRARGKPVAFLSLPSSVLTRMT